MKRLLLLALLLPLAPVHAQPVRDKHVEAELLAEPASIQPGQPFWVALKLVMDEDWHTYWVNPGDSGLGTKIAWKLPEGFTASPIAWPMPHRISTPPLMSYGYEREVLLLARITPPADLPASEVTLGAKASWLMCKEACIPGRAELAITLPVRSGPAEADARRASDFAAARAALPVAPDGWTVRARYRESGLLIEATLPQGWRTGQKDVYFFADGESVTEAAAPQAVDWDGRTLRLSATRSSLASELPARLTGVLVSEQGWSGDGATKAVALDVELAPGDAVARAFDAPTAPARAGRSMTVPAALLFAFLGGLILNLMPCVFPVVSLKVLGFVEQAGESRGRLFAHGLVFAAGVLTSFWALAGALLALRAGGSEIGWGFQLQHPAVVIVLAAIFFLLGLSLFGVFEIGLSLTGAGSNLQARKGFGGSFFSGLLATIVATPCTAPFMGAALGYALALPTFTALLIFTMLGIGMAAPYLVLAASPGLISRIPRPGPWMETMKQLMGFLMMATVVWLAWVLGVQVGNGAVIALMAAFVALGLAAWILGRWAALHRPFSTRLAARLLALVLVLAAVLPAIRLAREGRGAPAAGPTVTAGGIVWEPWSPARVAELRAAGTPILVDFTAAWCLTCQVNKRVALHQREVEARLKQLGIATLKADWTYYDEAITRGLAEFGRSGVPLYVLYGRDRGAPPVLLPEILTPQVVLKALDGIR